MNGKKSKGATGSDVRDVGRHIVLIGGVLAALWEIGVLASIGTTWTLTGVVILNGLGMMIAVCHSGTKESIEINRK